MKIPTPANRRRTGAFTLLELMIVIIIIAILGALSFPVFAKIKALANEAVCVNNLKQISSATMLWAADHGDKLPSPKYSGNEPDLPKYAMLGSDGEEGLWLNGVVFAQIYFEEEPETDDSGNIQLTAPTNLADSGKHLVGTVFESTVSTAKNADERDWYRHSYAMNANIMYDELAILRDLPNPWYSEKALSKLEPAATMLYIDCTDANIVMASDLGLILDTADDRYNGKKILAAFVDGRVEKIHPNEIPDGNIESDREASFFWRGVMPD